jgi:hypothetical protein
MAIMAPAVASRHAPRLRLQRLAVVAMAVPMAMAAMVQRTLLEQQRRQVSRQAHMQVRRSIDGLKRADAVLCWWEEGGTRMVSVAPTCGRGVYGQVYYSMMFMVCLWWCLCVSCCV